MSPVIRGVPEPDNRAGARTLRRDAVRSRGRPNRRDNRRTTEGYLRRRGISAGRGRYPSARRARNGRARQRHEPADASERASVCAAGRGGSAAVSTSGTGIARRDRRPAAGGVSHGARILSRHSRTFCDAKYARANEEN